MKHKQLVIEKGKAKLKPLKSKKLPDAIDEMATACTTCGENKTKEELKDYEEKPYCQSCYRNKLLDEVARLWAEVQSYGQNCVNAVGRLVDLEKELVTTEEQ